jgi:general secretion pathway protein A
MAADKLLSLYGLKFNPFRSGIPAESLYVTPVVDAFCRRVELTIADGGFALVTGEPGTGKSGALRVIAHRLAQLPDVTVRTIDRPQSGVSDFYRELGELYGINLRMNNRWGGFKALRTSWSNHISQSLTRPILIIDESQQMLDSVFFPNCGCFPGKTSILGRYFVSSLQAINACSNGSNPQSCILSNPAFASDWR